MTAGGPACTIRGYTVSVHGALPASTDEGVSPPRCSVPDKEALCDCTVEPLPRNAGEIRVNSLSVHGGGHAERGDRITNVIAGVAATTFGMRTVPGASTSGWQTLPGALSARSVAMRSRREWPRFGGPAARRSLPDCADCDGGAVTRRGSCGCADTQFTSFTRLPRAWCVH